MFFEGTEKKLQIIFAPEIQSLRALGNAFWEKVVKAANADILSSVSNERCDAYLLSESSLFVWDDRFILITCGQTTLVNSAILIVEHFGEHDIRVVNYQRQNEFRSMLQQSNFQQDVDVLRYYLEGKAIQIGELDEHHHYLFTSAIAPADCDSIQNYQLKMYNITGNIVEHLMRNDLTAMKIRDSLRISSLFKNFIIDDYVFTPFGYSINGIKDDEYFTIHITPQDESSYASFETNIHLSEVSEGITEILLDIFKPVSWDIISFNKNNQSTDQVGHWKLAECIFQIDQAVKVYYESYHQPETQTLYPRPI